MTNPADEKKKAILERAIADKQLLGEVPPIVAFAFGVLPISKQGTVLTVACSEAANRDAIKLLREVLDHEIVAVPFAERTIQEFVGKAHPNDDAEPINFPTFEEPGFLARKGVAALLRASKVERVGETGSRLEPGRVVLASHTYRGLLENLEHPRKGAALPDPRRMKYELHDDDLAWTRELDGSPAIWPEACGATSTDAALYLNEFRFSDHRNLGPGALYAEHAVQGTALTPGSLPYVVHPTEVQLTRLERTGALVYHVYDREERVEPGRTHRFTCRYHFLSFGQRLRREIEILVHDVALVERAGLASRTGRPRWGPCELERWFSS